MIVDADALDRIGVTAVARHLTILLAFGAGARNLDAGVGTGLLSLGLRGPYGLFCVGAGLLGLGLRRPQGLLRFGPRTLGLGSRLFDFPVGGGGFAARVLQFDVGPLYFA